MALQAYEEHRFTKVALQLMEKAVAVVNDYMAQGYVLTVRQLYYQLVARGHIENTMRSYKRVVNLLLTGRMAGLIDWDAIEDRTRSFISKQRWGSPKSILQAASNSYHEDMWENQITRCFVVIEKEALVGVLEQTCRDYDVPLLAARGYPSVSVLRDFVMRDLNTCHHNVKIIHLGDHDPSGIDMTTDLGKRLTVFMDREIEVRRIALNMDQVRKLKPPPNPAKQTDSRFESYHNKFGAKSWELDAIPPEYLNRIVKEEIEEEINFDQWAKDSKRVTRLKKKIDTLGKKFK